MDDALLELLEKLAKFGEDNDARETERPKRMLNITRDTGRLLWIIVRATGATRIVEVGGLPRMLGESDYHIEWTPELKILDDDTERIYAWDSSGKEWALSRKQMRRLRRERTELGKAAKS